LNLTQIKNPYLQSRTGACPLWVFATDALSAEKVLADLEGKRQKLLTFAQQLTEVRRAHAYAAHVADDLVQSGHPSCAHQCPILGVKRTWPAGYPMSAFDPNGHEQRLARVVLGKFPI
jgi:hypothetical protein